MTVIITHINRHGIIHGADSNITEFSDNGITYISGTPKLFAMPTLNSAITVAGNWTADGVDMDIWMPRFIEAQIDAGTPDLRTFSRNLRNAWVDAISINHRRFTNWAHLSGYQQSNGKWHPEFWAVNNVISQEPDNLQVDPVNFHYWEDLSTYDCRLLRPRSLNRPYDLYQLFSETNDASVTYVNGHVSGRLFNNLCNLLATSQQAGPVVRQFLSEYMTPFVGNSDASARLIATVEEQLEILEDYDASSLSESENMMRRSINVISNLFELLDDGSVGGTPSVLAIASPSGMITTCRQAPIYSETVINNNLPPTFDN